MAYKASVGLQSGFTPVYTLGADTIHLRLPKQEDIIPDDAFQAFAWKHPNASPNPELLCFAQVSHTRDNGDMYFSEFCIVSDASASPPQIRALPFTTKLRETVTVKKDPEIELDGETEVASMNLAGYKGVEMHEVYTPAEEITDIIEKVHPSPFRLLNGDKTLIRPSRMSQKHSKEAQNFLAQHLNQALQGFNGMSDQLEDYNAAKQEIATTGITTNPGAIQYASAPTKTHHPFLTDATPASIKDQLSQREKSAKKKNNQPDPSAKVDTSDLVKAALAEKPRTPQSKLPQHDTIDPGVDTEALKVKNKPKSRQATTGEASFYYTPDPQRPNVRREKDHCSLSLKTKKPHKSSQQKDWKELKALLNGNFDVWVPLEDSKTQEPHFFVVKRNSSPTRNITEATLYKINQESGCTAKWEPFIRGNLITTHPAHNMTDSNLLIADQIAKLVTKDALVCWQQAHDAPRKNSPHFKHNASDAPLLPPTELTDIKTFKASQFEPPQKASHAR